MAAAGGAHLSRDRVNVGLLRECARRELLQCLNKQPGSKVITKKKMNGSVEQTGLEVNIILISGSQFQEIYEFNQSTHKLKGSMELFDLSVARRKTERAFLFSLLPTLEGIQSISDKEVNYIADGKGGGGRVRNKQFIIILLLI